MRGNAAWKERERERKRKKKGPRQNRNGGRGALRGKRWRHQLGIWEKRVCVLRG